jgi:hypothetical protein
MIIARMWGCPKSKFVRRKSLYFHENLHYIINAN